MCMICASIPAAVAVGAKLNANQLNKLPEDRKPIAKVTGIVMVMLLAGSFIYHTLTWRS